MKNISIVVGLVAVAFSGGVVSAAVGYVSDGEAARAPLSCRVKVKQSVDSAKLRDQGTTREELEIVFKMMGEFTKKEVKTILDRVYITMKKRTPAEIGKAVSAACYYSPR